MKEEQVILVDINDNPIGLSPKMEAHRKALLHRAFSVFIFNNEGKLLLQQRASHKYHSPKLWTNTVCSHQQKNESNLQAGKRRLNEEMGMTAELKEIFHFIYKAELDQGLTEHELDHVMIGFSNDNPVINPDEVMDYRWETLKNIQADIKNNSSKYTEWFKIIFKNSLHKLNAELENYFLNYPISFSELFKEKPWGGKKLKTTLNKNIYSDKIGESWEISTYPDNISIVKSGFFEGENLEYLLKQFKDKLLGEKVLKEFNNSFPLLIKYIDARNALSVQVHPGDKMAKKYHDSFGKNELWHIIQADNNSVLYIGLKSGTTKEDYLKAIKEENIENILNIIPVNKGDTFYIPAGTVHAIGKGILLAEIQQTSNVTYRIYDWNRIGLNGNPRELHLEKAIEAIDFSLQPDKRNQNIIKTPYFQIKKQMFSKTQIVDISEIDSFIILMNTGDGNFKIDGINFSKGDTLLLPAVKNNYEVEVINKGCFLQVFI